MKELIITTDNLTAEQVVKVGADRIKDYATPVGSKKEVTKVGTFGALNDKGGITIFTAVEADLADAFLSEAINFGLEVEEVDEESDLFLHWADGYKRSIINRAGHEKVATDLGLKAPSKTAEKVAKVKEEVYGDMVAKLVATGMDAETAKRIVYGK